VLEEIERRKRAGAGVMNALDPTVAEFRERLKHQRTEKKRRLNAMNCKPYAPSAIQNVVN
jgi:hypothetical protein